MNEKNIKLLFKYKFWKKVRTHLLDIFVATIDNRNQTFSIINVNFVTNSFK